MLHISQFPMQMIRLHITLINDALTVALGPFYAMLSQSQCVHSILVRSSRIVALTSGVLYWALQERNKVLPLEHYVMARR